MTVNDGTIDVDIFAVDSVGNISLMQTQSIIGDNIAPEVVGLVAKHHERMDGNGYFSYHGDNDVPKMCRILSIADHYNSKIRGYYDSPAMIPSSVLKEI